MYNTDYSISQQFTDPLEEERKRRERELQMLQTGAGPISPDQLGQLPEMPSLPEAGPSVDVAGPTQMPQQPMAQTPAVTPEAQKIIQQQTVPFNDALQQSQNDQKKMWELYSNSQYTPEQRQIAGAQLSDMMRQEYEKNKATQFIKTATPEDLNKMLTARTSEGNWGKAVLFGLLGMEQSARDEAAKLGVGAKWTTQQVTDPRTGETTNVLYKMRADGLPMEGYNAQTGQQLSSKELAGLAAGGMKLDLVGGTYVNDRTGEVGRVVTDKNTGQSWIQTDKGRKSLAGFRPQSSTGTMEDMRARAVQDLNIKLAGKTMEEKLAILRPYNQQLVAQGIAPVQPSEIGLQTQQVPQNFNQRPGQPAGAPAMQAQPQMAPAPTAQPQPARPAPVIPTPLSQQPTVAPQPSPFSTFTPTGTGLGGRPTGADIEAQKTKQKEAAQEEGVDLGKAAVNQGKNEANADYLITKVGELVKHPGFETSVGAKGPTMGFGAFKTPFSGTDAADFAARFEEIQGQSFLTAIENLRGMGALSNIEGETATKAIKRMSTTQSEAEFKQAAKEFQDIIMRGIDRTRGKLGQEPKYNIPAESEQAKKRQGQGQWRVINVQPGQ